MPGGAVVLDRCNYTEYKYRSQVESLRKSLIVIRATREARVRELGRSPWRSAFPGGRMERRGAGYDTMHGVPRRAYNAKKDRVSRRTYDAMDGSSQRRTTQEKAG